MLQGFLLLDHSLTRVFGPRKKKSIGTLYVIQFLLILTHFSFDKIIVHMAVCFLSSNEWLEPEALVGYEKRILVQNVWELKKKESKADTYGSVGSPN